MAAMAKDIDFLKSELDKLKSLQEIRDLKYRYYHIIDHFLYDSMGEVFTEDASATMGPYGLIEGRESLDKFFNEEVYPNFDMILHGAHNPQIVLTSESTARGTWMYEVFQMTSESTPTGVWLCGLYRDEYVRVDGQWKIKYLEGSYYFNTNGETPWLRDRYSAYPPGAPGLPREFRLMKGDDPKLPGWP